MQKNYPRIQKTDVEAPKINGSSLNIFKIVITGFLIQDKLGKARFFQKIFLVADTRMDIVLRMPFFTLSNADIWFTEGELTWKAYTAIEVLPTTKRIQIIN